MKKSILLLLAFGLFNSAFSQTDNKKPGTIGIHFVLNDFQTAADIRSTSLVNVINEKQWFKTSRMAPGIAVSYMKGMMQNLDLAATLSGSFVKYPYPDRPKSTSDEVLFEAAATANLKLLSDKYFLNPFLTGGVGASKYSVHFGAFTVLGVGLQIKPADNFFIILNSQYRMPASSDVAYHFYNSFGMARSFPKPKAVVVAAPEVPVVADRDGDGVADADDKCPDTPGLASLQGCPDRDGDGIADADDKCPDEAGLAKYGGCPIPDTDGDGINDEMDKCPTVKGVARYQGCPIPDTDNDGVNDEEDKCPTRPGPASNQGCPVIAKEVIEKVNMAAKNVFFSTGSYKLLPKSFKSLNDVASILKADESLMIDIDGYTDSQGSDELNQTLSENRAKSVKDYLVSKGIDESRLKSTGYGETNPIADNKTAAGRAKNRRTEMTIRNY
ncbi:MAG: OmpA family protein [Niastella sp.]|nr:OmpA family protein [Niastella sp.]